MDRTNNTHHLSLVTGAIVCGQGALAIIASAIAMVVISVRSGTTASPILSCVPEVHSRTYLSAVGICGLLYFTLGVFIQRRSLPAAYIATALTVVLIMVAVFLFVAEGVLSIGHLIGLGILLIMAAAAALSLRVRSRK